MSVVPTALIPRVKQFPPAKAGGYRNIAAIAACGSDEKKSPGNFNGVEVRSFAAVDARYGDAVSYFEDGKIGRAAAALQRCLFRGEDFDIHDRDILNSPAVRRRRIRSGKTAATAHAAAATTSPIKSARELVQYDTEFECFLLRI